MLFPILAVRDFGLLGWLAFALPNVLGATAVGFLQPAQLRWLLERKATAVLWFSGVTVALHGYVLTWLVVQSSLSPALVGSGVVLLALLSHARSWRLWGYLGVLCTLASALALATGLRGIGLSFPAATVQPPGIVALAAFATANIFGFLACPFLDASLLGIAAAIGNRSRRLFVAGFCGLFLATLCAVLGYAKSEQGLFQGSGDGAASQVLPFLALQALFTTGLHLAILRHGRLGRSTSTAAARRAPALDAAGHCLRALTPLAAGVLLAGIASALPELPTADPAGVSLFGRAPFELVYRSLLVLYGAGFPAYLVLAVSIRRTQDDEARLKARSLLRWCVVGLTVTAGFFYFVAGTTWALVPAIATLGAGVLALRRGTGERTQERAVHDPS